MRIVSLAPSATSTLTQLGVANDIVATAGPADIDCHSLGGWLTFNPQSISEYNPDVVITMGGLQDDLQTQVASHVEADTVHLDPRTLPAVIESFAALGEAVGVPERGKKLEATAEQYLQRAAFDSSSTPTVYCEEWNTPPMAAGNWVPDIVSLVGGSYSFVESGERSTQVTQETVEAASPDITALHACGDRTVTSSMFMSRDWDVPAVESGFVVSMPDAWLNQPSPQLLNGVIALRRLVTTYEQNA